MSSDMNLRSDRALTLGSGCVLKFLLHDTGTTKELIPVLMLIGLHDAAQENATQPYMVEGNPRIGIISTSLEKDSNQNLVINTNLVMPMQDSTPVMLQPYDSGTSSPWLIISSNELIANQYYVVEPRVGIMSLGLKTDSSELNLKYYDKTLKNSQIALRNQTSEIKPYEDYSILSRSNKNEYVLTLDEKLIIKNNYEVKNGQVYFEDGPIQLKYSISNADTAIYLDAMQILKENAYPKVSYEATVESVDNNLINTIYNRMGNIVNINDNDLKFKNVRGYISGFTLNLDNPDEDQVEIKNYKTKFEDLFSTITAQTEAMKSNSYMLDVASAAFTPTGQISEEVLQSTIKKVDLDYAFDNGKLTIDEQNGIWGTSDTGVVAFRGGGIFTATEKHDNGGWKWNTGITPEGINADLITTGQLDTNLIKIYAGDHLRFQMNGDGIFAYKLKFDADAAEDAIKEGKLKAENSFDNKQYVVFNDEGLSLIAKKGAEVLTKNKTSYYEVLNNDVVTKHASTLGGLEEIKRVEISWQGLILRNWLNESVFYADPQTGNLTLKGTIEAESGRIGAWNFDDSKLFAEGGVKDGVYYQYVALDANSNNEYVIWAGNKEPAQAQFSVKKNGTLKATSGNIGGWTMAGNLFYNSGSVAFAPGGSQAYIDVPTTKPNGEEDITEIVKKQVKYIMWAPGPSSPSEITSSLRDAAFTLTHTGELTAYSVNGWYNMAGAVAYAANKNGGLKIITNTSSTGISGYNLSTGQSFSQTFDTLQNATATFSAASGGDSWRGDSGGRHYVSKPITLTCRITTASGRTHDFTGDLTITAWSSADIRQNETIISYAISAPAESRTQTYTLSIGSKPSSSGNG